MTSYLQVSGVVTATVGDELVLLNPNTEVFFSLNETGQRIWELLGDGATEDDLVAALTQEYDIDAQRCRDAVSGFLAQAADHGVVQAS